MTNIYKSIVLGVILLATISNGYSQSINWTSLKKENKHIINANVGYDYGMNFGVGYGYQLDTKMPIILNAEYSFPAGQTVFDDFKTKIGGEIKLHQIKNFVFSAKVQGVFRRYDNPSVRMLNFGSEFSGIVGFYKTRWFVASEFGFDKAIVTNFKHTTAMKENNPGLQDGWYEPATGGNFFYGLSGGYSFKQNDIYLKLGSVVSQDFKTTPLIPFYLELGYQIKI